MDGHQPGGLLPGPEIFNPRGIYGRWGWRGLVAYLLGFVAMLPFAKTGLLVGPVAAALGTDVGMVPGLIVAGGSYLLFCRNLDLPAERAAIAEADAGLDANLDTEPAR